MRLIDVVSEAEGTMRALEVFATPYQRHVVTIISAGKTSLPVDAFVKGR